VINSESGTPRTRVVYVFSYREHGDQSPHVAALESDDFWQEFIRLLREFDWEQDTESDPSWLYEPELHSLDELQAHVREYFPREDPDAQWRIPFEKLATLMTVGNWSFAFGTLIEFEGNHNDTEIHVVLERVSGTT